MKAFKDLGTDRCEPCREWPGRWLMCWEGGSAEHATFEEALEDALTRECAGASVCWEASEGDPRIGQVWFTGFYRAGTVDAFGLYRST